MNSDNKSPSRIRLLSALLLIGVFAAGIAAGFGISRWCEPKKPPLHGPHADHLPGTPGPIPGLELSREQKQKADAIREKYRPELEAIVQDTFPKVREINLKMEAELRAILSPEQLEAHDRFKESLPHKHKAPPTKRP